MLLLASCGNSGESRGPIVLGDPSTIVTETDSSYLRDFVADVKIREIQKAPDTVAAAPPPADTARAQEQTPTVERGQTSPLDDGLHIPFNEITVFIPDIKIRSFRKQDPSKLNSVSYMLTNGTLKGNSFRITGATITRVSQRYITSVVAKNNLGTLVLENLNHTSEWTVLKGKNDTYPITGLEETKLRHANPTPTAIRKAVQTAAAKKRLSRQTTQRWVEAVRNTRSVNQRPLDIKLRSVIWKIQGKDDHGKAFEKLIRIDLPV